MNIFFKIAAYLFHPLWIPTFSVGLYFWVTPRFLVPEIIQTKLLVVFILTFLIPLLAYFVLKNLNLVKTLHLEDVNERKIPLMLQCILLLVIIKIVFSFYNFPELYFFFVGVLISAITAFILVVFKFKISLHMIGVAGLTMFLIALSIHFKINILMIIGLFLMANGWVAASRLHTNSHTMTEIIMGIFIGFLPQLILLNYWL